jgi:hypothetical protein
MTENKSVQKIQRSIDNIVKKIDRCVNYEMIYCLEEDFNDIGMTLQPAKKDRMILCTIVEGTPTARRIFEDYIHIGSLEHGPNEIPLRLIECIKDFVVENARLPSTPLNAKRASQWQSAQNGVYGNFVTEDIVKSVHDEPVVKGRLRKKKSLTEGTDPSQIAKTIMD